jgi:hypothetical protein
VSDVPPTGTTVEYPLALRLLDHQIEGPDGSPLANVDDLELELSPAGLTVTALLCGPGALGERLPGRIGRWTLAVWRRLSLDPHPSPLRISLMEVRDIGSAVVLSAEAASAVQQRLTLENWLRDHLIAQLPGSRLEPSPEPGPRLRRAPVAERPERGVRTLLMSRLLGTDAVRDGASLGRVHEVLATRSTGHGPVVGPLEVTGYVVGPRDTGSTFGYDRHPETGPWILRALIGLLHRRDEEIRTHDVLELDPIGRRLVVR